MSEMDKNALKIIVLLRLSPCLYQLGKVLQDVQRSLLELYNLKVLQAMCDAFP